jgi:hypothetical protein
MIRKQTSIKTQIQVQDIQKAVEVVMKIEKKLRKYDELFAINPPTNSYRFLQLNFIRRNYTEAAATCSASQQHSTFTVQILYKLYSLQLNCTNSNYTEAAATCSAAQQHSTITVQILYKL